MRQGTAAPAALALAVAVGACGGGAKRPTYPEFQQAANAICVRYSRGVDRLGSPHTLSGVARLARRAYALGERERTELRQLEPPKDAAGAYGRFLDRTQTADAMLPALWRAASQGDQAAVRQLATHGKEAAAAANSAARELGLDDCRRA